jgi:hypothetical protein
MESETEVIRKLREASERILIDEPPVERIARRGRHRIVMRLSAAGLAGTLVVAGLVAGLVSISHIRRTVDHPPTPSPQTIRHIDVFGRPIRRPVAAFGAFWTIVARDEKGTALVRVDGVTLQARLVEGLKAPQAVTAGYGSVWVATCGGCRESSVVRLDGSGQIIAQIPTGPGRLYPIAAGEGAVWAELDRSPDKVSVIKIDPGTNTVAGEVKLADQLPHRLSCCPGEIAPGYGAVWLVAGDRLVRLDPQTLTITMTKVPAILVTAGAKEVWANTARFGVPGPIVQIDPTTGKVIATVQGPGFGYLTQGGPYVWLAVTSESGGSIDVYRINPVTNTIERVMSFKAGPVKSVTRELGPGGPPQSIAVGEGALWVTDQHADQVIRISADERLGLGSAADLTGP